MAPGLIFAPNRLPITMSLPSRSFPRMADVAEVVAVVASPMMMKGRGAGDCPAQRSAVAALCHVNHPRSVLLPRSNQSSVEPLSATTTSPDRPAAWNAFMAFVTQYASELASSAGKDHGHFDGWRHAASHRLRPSEVQQCAIRATSYRALSNIFTRVSSGNS